MAKEVICIPFDYLCDMRMVVLFSRIGPNAFVVPIKLWTWCARHLPNGGGLIPLAAAAIEMPLDWRGVPGSLIGALVEAGFLVVTDVGYLIPDWFDIYPPKRIPVPKALVEEVLKAGRCVVCGATEDLTVDHKIPVSQGGPNTLGNLHCMCRSCNLRKGSKWPGGDGV